MEQSVAGKKLLIMGGRPAATPDIVRAAKQMGVYTIVTDNVAPEKSPAKRMADAYWDISTAEVERLAERVREESVDGIFTGVHEFNLKKTKKLCALCGKPFYASEEQLRLNFDKVLFKESCKQAGIDVPESYTNCGRCAIRSSSSPGVAAAVWASRSAPRRRSCGRP